MVAVLELDEVAVLVVVAVDVAVTELVIVIIGGYRVFEAVVVAVLVAVELSVGLSRTFDSTACIRNIT